jgi:hypothetical protein
MALLRSAALVVLPSFCLSTFIDQLSTAGALDGFPGNRK